MEKARMIFKNKGSLTIQFLLSFCLVLVFVMLLTMMAFSLAVAEFTQYITYASSRHLFLSSENINEQKKAAEEKYKYFTVDTNYKNLFGKLFEITPASNINSPGSMGINTLHFPPSGDKPYLFYGVWTIFKPKVLTIETMWGDTEEDADFFKTTIGSYLGREVSASECRNFIRNRMRTIMQKHPATVYPASDPEGYYESQMNFYNSGYYDNGC